MTLRDRRPQVGLPVQPHHRVVVHPGLEGDRQAPPGGLGPVQRGVCRPEQAGGDLEPRGTQGDPDAGVDHRVVPIDSEGDAQRGEDPSRA